MRIFFYFLLVTRTLFFRNLLRCEPISNTYRLLLEPSHLMEVGSNPL